jgi:hypothetical protein
VCLIGLLCAPAFGGDTLTLQVNDNTPITLMVENYQGHSLVPVKSFSKIIGAALTHGEDGGVTLSKNGIVLTLYKNSAQAFKNGKSVSLPVAPRIQDGKMYAPLRSVCELLNMSVSWDAASARAKLENRETRNGKTAEDIILESSKVMDELVSYRFDSQSRMSTQINNEQPATVQVNMTEWVRLDPFAIKIRQITGDTVQDTYVTDTRLYTRTNEGPWAPEGAVTDIQAFSQSLDSKSDPKQAMDRIKTYGVAYSFNDDLFQDGKRYYVINACMGAESFRSLIQSTESLLTDSEEKAELNQFMQNSSFEMYYTIYINQDNMMQEIMTYDMDISAWPDQNQVIHLTGSGKSAFSGNALFEEPLLPADPAPGSVNSAVAADVSPGSATGANAANAANAATGAAS